MEDWIWMRHPDIADPARFAADAAEVWQARGWEPCDPPAEPDPTAEPRREAPPTPAERAAETPTEQTPVDKTEPKRKTNG